MESVFSGRPARKFGTTYLATHISKTRFNGPEKLVQMLAFGREETDYRPITNSFDKILQFTAPLFFIF